MNGISLDKISKILQIKQVPMFNAVNLTKPKTYKESLSTFR